MALVEEVAEDAAAQLGRLALAEPLRQPAGATPDEAAALETQESLTDVFFGTHNVRAWWDQPGDLLAGLVGTLTYPALVGRMLRPR